MISRIRSWFGRSLVRKFALLFAGFLLLQALQLGVGIFGIMHIGEEGAAINEAGRQRYRTVLLGTLARGAPGRRRLVGGTAGAVFGHPDRLRTLLHEF